MEGVNVQLYFPKPMRCSSRIDPSNVTRKPLRCYYRRSKRRSKRKVLHLRRQLQDQQKINRTALPAALDEIKRLEIALEYANKENAALKRALQDKQPAMERTVQPLAQKEKVTHVSGVELGDFARAVAASLESIEQDLETSLEAEAGPDSTKVIEGSATTTVVSSEKEVAFKVTSSEQGGVTNLPAPDLSAESSSEASVAGDKSLGDLMNEKKQSLQEWMIHFCRTRCFMSNNISNLVSISDRLAEFSAGIEGIIESVCKAEKDKLRAALTDLHNARLTEVRAVSDEEYEAKMATKEEELAALSELHAERLAEIRAMSHEEYEAKIAAKEEELHQKFLTAINGGIATESAALRKSSEEAWAVKVAEIEESSQVQEAQVLASLKTNSAQTLSDDRLELEKSFTERGMKLRSRLDREAEEKVTKALDDWKEIYEPIIKLGALASDRKMHKALRRPKRNDDIIEKANRALHGGSIVADASRFHPSLPPNEKSKSYTKDGFITVYGINPELALKFVKCEKFVRLCNCRASMKECHRANFASTTFFSRCEPLWKRVAKVSSLEDMDQLLDKEEHTDTIAFLENECRIAMEELREEKRDEYRLVEQTRKSGTPMAQKFTPASEANEGYGVSHSSPMMSSYGPGSGGPNNKRLSYLNSQHHSSSSLTLGTGSTDMVDEPHEPESPRPDGDGWNDIGDDEGFEAEAEDDVGEPSNSTRTHSSRGGRRRRGRGTRMGMGESPRRGRG